MQPARFYHELFVQDLGLDVLGLESTFPTLVKVIETKTINAFSNYISAYYKIYLNLEDEKNIIRKDHVTLGVEYRIDDPVLKKFHLPILGVEQIDYSNNGGVVDPFDPNSAEYYNSILASKLNLSLDNVLMGAEYTYNRTLTDFAMPWKRYFEYRGDNLLYLRNYAFGGTVEITVRTNWPNLASIPAEFYQEFMTLARYDVKVYLFSSLKYLSNITTPAGNLDLKIDDWDGASREREDYLKELRTRAFSDRVNVRYFKIC